VSVAAVACQLNAAAALPGDLDTNEFGAGFGRVLVEIGSTSDEAKALAIQPDGRLVVAALCPAGLDFKVCLARFERDGSLDASFDGDGKRLTNLTATPGSVAALTSGHILIGAQCDGDLCVMRVSAEGSNDASFGVAGVASGGFSTVLQQSALLVQADGKILVGGRCSVAGNWDFCIARFLPNGVSDPSWGVNGWLTVAVGGNEDFLKSLVENPDGTIYAVGACVVSGIERLCVLLLSANGTPINSATWSLGTGTVVGGYSALQPDGKLVVATSCTTPTGFAFCVRRLNKYNGVSLSVDVSEFGSLGEVMLSIGPSDDLVSGLLVQDDGKIVVSGSCWNPSQNRHEFCVARLHSTGALDTGFGDSGTRVIVMQPDANPRSAATSSVQVQADGKIVLAGTCNGDTTLFSRKVCLARLIGGPFGNRACSLDIDGDGAVYATTDALIHARIALGVRGAQVLNGVNIPSHAARRTWSAIREYLVTQCRLPIAP
jgi:uncharacterized delta-60 repeat protein